MPQPNAMPSVGQEGLWMGAAGVRVRVLAGVRVECICAGASRSQRSEFQGLVSCVRGLLAPCGLLESTFAATSFAPASR